MGYEFLREFVQGVVVVAGVGIFALTQAARRYPHVPWLRQFLIRDHRTEEQKRRARRRASMMGGLQFIMLGIVIPPGYMVLDLMTWSDTSRTEIQIVSAIALVFVGIGITAIVRARSA
jgi:hypothetical protein